MAKPKSIWKLVLKSRHSGPVRVGEHTERIQPANKSAWWNACRKQYCIAQASVKGGSHAKAYAKAPPREENKRANNICSITSAVKKEVNEFKVFLTCRTFVVYGRYEYKGDTNEGILREGFRRILSPSVNSIILPAAEFMVSAKALDLIKLPFWSDFASCHLVFLRDLKVQLGGAVACSLVSPCTRKQWRLQ
jgi:hypothetical protein